MIVVGSAAGEREQHKFRVQSRHVDPVMSECGKVTLSSKRSIMAKPNLRKCKGCFGQVADQVGDKAPKPRRGGRHRK